jgi:hypothetical protein
MLREQDIYVEPVEELAELPPGGSLQIVNGILAQGWAYPPAGRRVEEWFAWFHRFQRGLTQHYVLYILLTLLAFLCSLFPFRQIVAHWFTR